MMETRRSFYPKCAQKQRQSAEPFLTEKSGDFHNGTSMEIGTGMEQRPG